MTPTSKISECRLEHFFASTGLTKVDFLSDLKVISRIKRLPPEVQGFAKSLTDYYNGVFKAEVTEIVENNARKNVNREVLSGREHLLQQKNLDNTIERDKNKFFASISAIKHKLQEEDSDVNTPHKKLHMDTVTPASEEHQPPIGENSNTASTISASTSVATSTSSSSSDGKALVVSTHTIFDPMKDPLSSVFLAGIDIGRAFSRLQLQSAEVVNDLNKMMSIQLPLVCCSRLIDRNEFELQSLPTEVGEWHSFHELISQYQPEEYAHSSGFRFSTDLIVSGESSLYTALDINVNNILSRLGYGRIAYHTEATVIGEPDFVYLLPDNFDLRMVIEAKTLWTLSTTPPDDLVTKYKRDMEEYNRRGSPPQPIYKQVHQIFGYLSYNKLRYGVLTSYDQTWFLLRELGNLYISPTIHHNNMSPTLLQCYAAVMALSRETPFSPPTSVAQSESPPSNFDDSNDDDYRPSGIETEQRALGDENAAPTSGERKTRFKGKQRASDVNEAIIPTEAMPVTPAKDKDRALEIASTSRKCVVPAKDNQRPLDADVLGALSTSEPVTYAKDKDGALEIASTDRKCVMPAEDKQRPLDANVHGALSASEHGSPTRQEDELPTGSEHEFPVGGEIEVLTESDEVLVGGEHATQAKRKSSRIKKIIGSISSPFKRHATDANAVKKVSLDNYEMQEVLGRGRSGCVFKAKWREEFVAVKICDLYKHSDMEIEMRTEVAVYDTLRPLQGICVPRLKEAGYYGGLFIIAMEVAGFPLDTAPLSLQDLQEIIDEK
ncbi:hypothetical protein BGX27_002120 [Mortierella sp. AM989]|nr:hypothetical protein BGX27_002120 [Mortierella sp. AM989]